MCDLKVTSFQFLLKKQRKQVTFFNSEGMVFYYLNFLLFLGTVGDFH
ncbi:hypothetical protein SpAn4DRAFT_4697 [Sporomusa ovata]|uniref:Uncharacterized protein n=1 Tax=Sporomusa ovata TaxID=2378 RepID=A0A0U1KSE8_9FIRM|nr:hypothetical protein SpAn4DRAFT_4697 [Sporomusa ovata]